MMLRNFYGFAELDRVGHFRRDAAWLRTRIGDPGSRYLPVWRTHNLVVAAAEPPRAALLAPDEIDPAAGEAVLLGLAGGGAIFALDLSAHDDPLAVIRHGQPLEFTDLRRVGPLLDRHEGSLLAYARGMIWWHGRHRFCGVCGAATASADAGHVRRCTDALCATTHFPRTDPAVIMLVTDGERALLGRQRAWPKGQFSTLAGFVEPGEALEDAVAREVFEETQIRIGEVRYHSSQPWPFPSSIMLGFTAKALSTAITVDRDELEDARWFERRFLIEHRDDEEFRLPRRDSIARRLIEDWLGR
ncbi:MAG: NAD(+) diphosphatase [Alphaproteobacteria bacterium]|nr:NAD(+) diphosphatase [Alphaproteobacteria bacterium]